MSEQEPVYKAVIRTMLDAKAQSLLNRWTALQMPTFQLSVGGKNVLVPASPVSCIHPSFVDNLLEVASSTARVDAIRQASDYLGGIGRNADLLNTYVTIDRKTYEVTTTFVLSNRDTALMLKLALG